MSDSLLPLLADVMTRLKGFSSLTALVPAARIYSDVPDNPTFPFIAVGITSQPYDTKTELGMLHTIQVNIYSRKTSPSEIGTIRAQVYLALHRQESSLTSSSVDSIIMNGTAATFKEPDGQTWAGVIQFDAIVT